MYKIRGVDGKEYGPVAEGVLRQWIAERRAAGYTKVQAAGSDEWKRLSEIPEFAAALAGVPPPLTPPPLPPSPASPVSGRASPPIRSHGLAVGSLVLGILGVCSGGLTAIFGLVLGIVALARIRSAPDRFRGKGLAIAGICVSAVFVLVMPSLLLPALVRVRARDTTLQCVRQAKEIGLAIRLYADENNGVSPAADEWCDAILANLPTAKSLQCPARTSERSGYGFNQRVAGRTLSSIPPDTVMVFEAEGGWNYVGGPDDLLAEPVHGQSLIVGFADGTARQVPPEDLAMLRWEP
jgi:hypothetical protein